MKFYLLENPMKPSVFAQFAAVGAWTDGSICESCGELIGGERAEPLQTEWEDGTDRIGSFSWSSYTCAVTDDVRQFLVERGVDCLFGRVEVMRPTRKTRRLRVPFPYTGPNLHWLMPTRRVPLNEARSSIKLVSDCPQCGQNLNEKVCGCSADKIDPRWAGLASVRVKLKEQEGK